MILFLKKGGAFLNQIRGWHLLSYQDYQSINRQEGKPIRFSQKQFSHISLSSWTTITYQLIKIFYLPRFAKIFTK